MKEANIFLIDLIPSTHVGCTLRDIVESCTKSNAYVKYESFGDGKSVLWGRELTNTIADCQRDLVIFVLSPCHLKQVGELIQSVREKFSVLPILIIAEKCKPEEMFSLLNFGATDFITPPLDNMKVLPRLWRLLEHKREQNTLTFRLKKKLGLKQLIGVSLPFLDEINKIPTVAKCDANVLIAGETGTGKDMCARAIHYLSPRAGRPFIPFNCGAVPTELMENELFGHVQGAFTGAATTQAGLISAANGGTLFLDDIDCLPATSQAKLLRFLQEKEYRQLGSAKMFQADVRVIAATNADLEAAVSEGKLRQDLYYRLNVIPLKMPALRDRREDIPLLARHFLSKYANDFNKHVNDFDSDAMKILMLYNWPGNVRELEHVVERALIFSENNIIREADIILPKPKTSACMASFKEAKANVVHQFEKNYIEGRLHVCKGNITRAAQSAQKNRRAFWQLIRKHQIDVQTFKPG
jgi:two-component system response regulator GlrR